MMANGLKRSFFWSFMEQSGASLIGFVVQIVFARLLAPELFGIMAILLVFISLMNTIAQSGLGLALVQSEEADDDSFSTALWLSLGLALAMYLLLFFIAPFIASFYQMDALVLLLRVLGIVVVFNSFNSIQRSYLQRSMDFKRLFKANLLSLLISGVVGICLAVAGCGIWALIGQSIIQGASACLFLFVFIPWRPKLIFVREEAMCLFRFGWKICVTSVLGTLYDGVSELVIGKTCNAVDLGYYSQGRKYPNMVSSITANAVSNVLFPAFSKLKGDMDSFRRSLQDVLKAGTFLVVPIAMLCCVIAEPLILLLLGEKWLPSVFIAQLTFAVNAFLMFDLVNLRAYMALGLSGLYMRLSVAKMVIGGLAICITAIVTRDIYVTAIVASAANVLGALFIDLMPARKVHGYGALCQLRDQLPTFFAGIIAAVSAGSCLLISGNFVVVMLLQVLVFAIAYVFASLIINRKTMRLCLDALGISR